MYFHIDVNTYLKTAFLELEIVRKCLAISVKQ